MKYVDEKGLAYVLSRVKQENTELKAECERLREDVNSAPCMQGEGENIKLEGTLEARFKKFSICGNSKQEVREGYNLLFNRQAEKLTINGIEFSIHEDGTVSVNGTATANAILNLLDNKTLDLAEGSYFLSGCPVGGSTSKYKFDMIEGMVGNPIAEDYGNGATLTLTESKSIQQARIVIFAGATVNNLLFKPMVCASTTEKPYESYGASPSVDFPSEIKTVKDSANVTVCNKNLFDKNSMPLLQGLWAGGNGMLANNGGGWYVVIPIVGGRGYTISRNKKGVLYTTTTEDYPVSGVKTVDLWSGSGSASQASIKTTANAKYLFLGLVTGSPTVEEKAEAIEGLQVEEDSAATDYIEHKEQSFTIDVQQEMLEDDGFEKVDGEWKEKHTWFEHVFNGTENVGDMSLWASNHVKTIDFRVFETNGVFEKEFKKYAKIMCSHLKNEKNVWSRDEELIECIENNHIDISINRDRIDGLTDDADNNNQAIKNYFKKLYDEGNPLSVWIKTDDYYLDCTDAQKAVLDEIEKTAKSYKDVTHIFSTDEISPIVHVEVRKDMQAENDKMQQEIDNLRQAIVALGGV